MSNRSVGGVGLVVFVKINSDLFIESFHGLAQYYNDNFNVDIDPSCKDETRPRFLSHDMDIFVNEKSKKFIAKKLQTKKVKKESFYFLEDDFTYILNQIQDKGIDLCQDSYQTFCEIGFAIGSQFGENGLQYFKSICQNGSKYDPQRIEKQYSKFCKSGGINISTFYYHAKNLGCELYSEKSKQIIKRVAVGKANSSLMTPESIIENLHILGLEASESDKPFIQKLINSKENFAKQIENEENETVKLEAFIKENYPIKKNNFNQLYELNKDLLNDEIINTITIHAKKYFDFKVSATDVSQLIFNSKANTYDPIKEYFKNNNTECTGKEIDEYASFITPKNKYNEWALKKWLVGAIHNWTSPIDDEEVSPLVLVLSGSQASGKTSFFRNMLPKELRKYFIDESMEEGGKDVMKRMATSMIMLNDEFGGMAAKDVKNFKKITETNKITIRLPYGRMDVAYDIYNSDFDFRLFSKLDIDYLNKNTVKNVEIEASEDLFFTKFSFTECASFSERVIMNQGEICNFMSLQFAFKISKYDIKRICLKHKMELKAYSFNGKTKKGYELFHEYNHKTTNEVPF
jgi:hypothetical protein